MKRLLATVSVLGFGLAQAMADVQAPKSVVPLITHASGSSFNHGISNGAGTIIDEFTCNANLPLCTLLSQALPAGTRTQTDTLTVTASNVLSALSKTPAPGSMQIVVNGVPYSPLGSAPPFTVSSTTVTWSAANAGFTLETTDSVQAIYSY